MHRHDSKRESRRPSHTVASPLSRVRSSELNRQPNTPSPAPTRGRTIKPKATPRSTATSRAKPLSPRSMDHISRHNELGLRHGSPSHGAGAGSEVLWGPSSVGRSRHQETQLPHVSSSFSSHHLPPSGSAGQPCRYDTFSGHSRGAWPSIPASRPSPLASNPDTRLPVLPRAQNLPRTLLDWTVESWSAVDMDGVQAPAEEMDDRTQDDIRKLLRMPEIEIPKTERVATPPQMSCKLMEHQKIALKWLKDQENDRHKRGGLLADTMGLGKTIEALALIMAHRPSGPGPKTTLIVAPLALLRQWDREIATKVKPAHKLSTFIYHGQQKRSRAASELYQFDIVITTYETIASEHRKYEDSRRRNSRLFGNGNRFYRIILDEAHKIKNRSSLCSKAVVDLDAKYRLCMTGTPFMNNTAEIYSLIRFLHIKPYDDWQRFSQAIERPLHAWNEDVHNEAIRKLQVLFRSFTLRRTKDSYLDGAPIIQLPELIISETAAEFNEDQQAFYTALELKQQIMFNRYLKKGKLSEVYTLILVLLLRLRQACCHPHLIKNHGIPDEAQLDGEQMVQLAMQLDHRVVKRVLSKREFQCPLCDEAAEDPIIIYPCGHDICADCFSMMMQLAAEARKGPEQSYLGIPVGNTEMDTVCPHDGCDSDIDPKKVLCHSFFLDAHSPDATGDGAEDSNLDDGDTCCSSDDDSSEHTGDDENIKNFIASDDEEDYLDSKEEVKEEVAEDEPERKFLSCVGRTPTPGPAFDSVDDDEGADAGSGTNDSDQESQGEEIRSCKGSMSSPAPSAPSDDEAEQTPSDRDYQQCAGDEDGEEVLGDADDPWANVLARYRASKKTRPDVDSDHDDSDLSSIQDFGVKSKPKVVSKKSTSKRKQGPGHKQASGPRKRVKEEDDTTPRKHHRGARSKAHKKRKQLTIAELRKSASTSKAARAKYFARVRAEFEPSAKTDVTLTLLRSIREDHPTEKTLVFSIWTSFLDLLEIPLRDQGFRYLRYDGSMTFDERDDNVKEFAENPNVKVLLVSLMAGNAGLNLTAASHVIILTPHWNPYVEDQAIDRAHRIGQKRRVHVHKVLVAGTVEDRMLELQEKKRRLVSAALSEEGARGAGRLSVHELRRLFGIR